MSAPRAGAEAGAEASIAVVGPTHPYTGGIAQHTTVLCHRLAEAGARVELVSWSAQYPGFLYPGTARVPDDEPEVTPFPRTIYPLAWNRPDTWFRQGRRLRRHDAVVLVVVTPFHAVPYTVLLRALGRRGRSVAVVHNVLPHEPSRFDRVLVRAMLRRFDGVVVHSEEQRQLAIELGGDPDRVTVAPLVLPRDPAAVPAAVPTGAGADTRPVDASRPLELLFFGTIRPYKGLDVLLRALALVPDARLVVAGDFWQGVEEYEALLRELGIADRVELRPGYVAESEVPGLFAKADALVLPYRSGTASFNVALAAMHGIPSVATDAGTLADEVTDGVDGLVVRSGDVEGLASALRQLGDPQTRARLRAGVSRHDTSGPWAEYARAVLTTAGLRPAASDAVEGQP
ncbi:MAG TPA: glycosyltransferase family 4 protein [Mycobacteriales bacterium]|nr:glycosyltransferase family 4 protein [Mycobacteriales bacterium]